MVATQTTPVRGSAATRETARCARPSCVAKDLPFAVLVQAEAIFGGRPDAVSIDADIEDVVVGKAVA